MNLASHAFHCGILYISRNVPHRTEYEYIEKLTYNLLNDLLCFQQNLLYVSFAMKI